jgi:hypothetical protein
MKAQPQVLIEVGWHRRYYRALLSALGASSVLWLLSDPVLRNCCASSFLILRCLTAQRA